MLLIERPHYPCRWLASCILAALISWMPGNSLLSQQSDTSRQRASKDPYFNPAAVGESSSKGNRKLTAEFPNSETAKSEQGSEGDFRAGAPTRLQPKQDTTSPFRPAENEPSARQPKEPVTAQLSIGPRNVSTPGVAFEPGRILALVGGEPIFVSDLIVEANQIVDQFIVGAPAEIKARERDKLIPRLLQKYIDAKLVFVEFKRGLPPEADLEEIIESAAEHFDDVVIPKLIEASNLKSAAELDAQFRAQGSSLRRMRQSWSETELIKYAMQEKMEVDGEVTHQELYERYQADKESYRLKARARWEQIMVRFDRFETRDEAWNAIADMGNKIILGASFSAVAKKQSHGFLANEGGMQGWTSQGSLADKSLDKLIFEIELSRLSDIVQTDKGLHIIRVLERTPDGFVPFTDAQIEIKEKILAEKREKAYRDYVDGLRERIPIEIYDSTQTAEQPTGTTLK